MLARRQNRQIRAFGLKRRMGLRGVSLLLLLSTPLMAQDLAGSVFSASRVVHRFDFDERASGNLEHLPKYWDPLRPAGFPHYTSASFDFAVGASAPPSFHLQSEGRNVAFQYSGLETRIRRNTDYRITGFVRADGLTHGRASLSAHFIDKFGRAMPATLVRSRYVGGVGEEGWVQVELHLPSAPEEAYTIGLVAWVLRESLWNDSVPARRHIPRYDIRGGAWFDDITIYALPRIELTTGAPGNVLTSSTAQELRVLLADDEDMSLYGRLSITSADGSVIERHPISVALDADAGPIRIPLDHLSPGLYHARLDVYSKKTMIVSRALTFARLASFQQFADRRARSFGVVVDPRFRSDPNVELHVLREQLVRSAKLPVWTGLADVPPSRQERRALDRLLQELVKSGFALTGVFFGPPSAIARSDGAYVRPLVELLAGSPGAWQEHLAAVVAPYASAFRWWQMGADSQLGASSMASPADGDERSLAITQLRDAMLPYITLPRLAAPSAADIEPFKDKLPVEQITLALSHALAPEGFASQIERATSMGYEEVSAYVDPLPQEDYDRVARLAHWAQRIIHARFFGATTVFVPQTWHVRHTPQGLITEPNETYVVMRTIAALLGEGEPGTKIRAGDNVTALAFNHDDDTTLVLWDSHTSKKGRTIPLQLGRAEQQIDLWGRTLPLARDKDGRHQVRIGRVPIFVPGIERWLIDLRTSVAIDPAKVESGSDLVKHTITMNYPGNRAVSGDLHLSPPDNWNLSPRLVEFNILPQRSQSHEIKVRYPHNEPAGKKKILAKINLTGDGYYLEIPLDVRIDVSDLDVWGTGVVEGGDLVLQHVVTNRSNDILSFRGSAAVPGRERQYRPISNLKPGDTQAIEYRFSHGEPFVGRDARLVLREVNDGPRIHNIDLTIP